MPAKSKSTKKSVSKPTKPAPAPGTQVEEIATPEESGVNQVSPIDENTSAPQVNPFTSAPSSQGQPESATIPTLPVVDNPFTNPETPGSGVETKAFGVSAPNSEGELVPLEKSNKKVYLVVLLICLIFTAINGGMFYFRAKMPQEETAELVAGQEDATASEAPEATAEPVTALTREEITIDILNGSGKAGVAKTTADTFEELGYTIGEIGNAEITEGNQLIVKKGLEDQLEILLEDVKEELDISSVSASLSDIESSAQIIIGK